MVLVVLVVMEYWCNGGTGVIGEVVVLVYWCYSCAGVMVALVYWWYWWYWLYWCSTDVDVVLNLYGNLFPSTLLFSQ